MLPSIGSRAQRKRLTDASMEAAATAAVASLPNQTFKNALINGDFNVWQRGTSHSSVAGSTYTADRWQYQKNGTMVHSIELSSQSPTIGEAGRLFTGAFRIHCGTAQASIGTTDYTLFMQKIEGYNFIPFAQRPLVLSFWVKATKTGIYCVSLRNGVADYSFIAEYRINASAVWERKIISVPASPAAGTWNYANGGGLDVIFTLASGSAFLTTPGTWNIGNFLATSNQVNGCDAVPNDFRITAIQLELGTVPTEFEAVPHEVQYIRCMRYYQSGGIFAGLTGPTVQNFRVTIRFNPHLRSTPTITVNAPGAGFTATNISSGAQEWCCEFSHAGTTDFRPITGWAASAEL